MTLTPEGGEALSALRPRTDAGREFARRIAHLNIVGDIGSILEIEREAALPAASPVGVDVILEFGQWLANDSTRMMRLRDAIEEDEPDEFRAIAAEFAAEEPR